MTTTDPKLIERVAEIIEAAIERHGCFSLRGTLDDARKIDALYAAAINEAVQKERAGIVEAMAELQLAAFLAGRGSVKSMKQGARTAAPAPSMDDFRRMASAAIEAKESQHGDA